MYGLRAFSLFLFAALLPRLEAAVPGCASPLRGPVYSLEASIKQYEALEDRLAGLQALAYLLAGQRKVTEAQLSDYLAELIEIAKRLARVEIGIVNDEPLSKATAAGLALTLNAFEAKLNPAPLATAAIAPAPELHQLTEVTADPSQILPGVAYSVVSEPFHYQIHFSERIVREVFNDPQMARQAKRALQAILNGFNGSASNHLKLIVSRTWIVQTSILSREAGTFRMYGVKKKEAIHFEQYIEKSNHSDDWVQSKLVPVMAGFYSFHFGHTP